MASDQRINPRNEQAAGPPAAGDVSGFEVASVESASEVENVSVTDLPHELRNLLASIQLAADTLTRCRPTCPAAGLVKSNVLSQVSRLSNLLDNLERVEVE